MPRSLPPLPAAWAVPFRNLAERTGVDANLRVAYQDAVACLDPVLDGTAWGRWNPKERRDGQHISIRQVVPPTSARYG
jgi:hypothetical protein